jgi:hypothetical protein
MRFKKLLFVATALLAISSPSFATFTPAGNSIQLGGSENASSVNIPANNPGGYFTIYANAPATAAHVSPFIKNGALYQVTVAKTFTAVKECGWSGTASNTFQLMSDTATFAADAAIGTLAAPVWQAGAAQQYPMVNSGTASTWLCNSLTYDFVGSTWPGVENVASSTGGYFLVGYEH